MRKLFFLILFIILNCKKNNNESSYVNQERFERINTQKINKVISKECENYIQYLSYPILMQYYTNRSKSLVNFQTEFYFDFYKNNLLIIKSYNIDRANSFLDNNIFTAVTRNRIEYTIPLKEIDTLTFINGNSFPIEDGRWANTNDSIYSLIISAKYNNRVFEEKNISIRTTKRNNNFHQKIDSNISKINEIYNIYLPKSKIKKVISSIESVKECAE